MCWPPANRILSESSSSLPSARSAGASSWQGEGVEEVGIDAATGKDLIRVDTRYFRPTEVDELVGDASKAARRLGWRATTSFEELVAEMVQSDLEAVPSEAWRKDRGSY